MSPEDKSLDALCGELSSRAEQLDQRATWPHEQLQLCGQQGVYRWFMPATWGGAGWTDAQVIRGYLKLSKACLTTTFIITQRTGACRRILASSNESLKRRLLPDLVNGNRFATVGISHLTTSRRHLAQPVLRAEETRDGFLLDGFSPWVTGAAFADTLVIGATLANGHQILAAVPTDLPGLQPQTSLPLTGLSASHTGMVQFGRVIIPHECLLAGPEENVMARGIGARTGGLETSTLAIGLASAALEFLEQEAVQRANLAEPLMRLDCERRQLLDDLMQSAEGNSACTTDEIRVRANSLVLRATQAALGAAKGTGYVCGHPVGRWCREALFFLVWSCPQPVLNANLCELAGLSD